jgi:hypothetical protein
MRLSWSPLFTNAIMRTGSGAAGGTVAVAVTAAGIIHVNDLGLAGRKACPGLPGSRRPPGGWLPERGQGRLIVAALSTGCVRRASTIPCSFGLGIDDSTDGTRANAVRAAERFPPPGFQDAMPVAPKLFDAIQPTNDGSNGEHACSDHAVFS